jgi:peptide/nickel transport system permease protein
MVDTFKRTGARLGAAWVAVLAICGVFAPFLANSHPFAMRRTTSGRTAASSPDAGRCRHPHDIRRLRGRRVDARGAQAHSTDRDPRHADPVAGALADVRQPPQTVVYERYRQLERDGKVERIIRAPVPYSPTDYLRDIPDVRRTPPSKQHWFGVRISVPTSSAA